jgi:hypothetical protein
VLAGTIAVLFAGSVTLSVAASDTYRDQVASDAAVAHWRMGETSGTTLVDTAGSNNGTYSGGFTLRAPGAIWNDASTAVSFDGVNGQAVVPDSGALDLSSAATVEAWVRRRNSGIFQPLVGKPTNGQSKLENYSIWLNTSNRPVAYFGNGTTYVSVAAPAALDTGWHHVVATYNNATARLYVDGAQVASVNSTVQLTPNASPLYMARSSSGSYSSGVDLDEVAIYPTVLSAARIAAHFSAARTDGEAPTVTLTSPPDGVTTTNTRPTFSGAAGALGGDSPSITVKVYAGSQATGTPVQTLSATRGAGGGYSVQAAVLTDGQYVARAEQRDDAGNAGVSAVRSLTIDTGPPHASITQSPPDPSNSSAASFSFGADEPAAFECSLDGAAFATCTSPRAYSGLADGSHTFRVKATDTAGNVGPVASSTWRVDTAAPSVTISDGPPSVTADTDAELTFAANEPSTLECSLDDDGFSACTSPKAYSELADGGHTFRVRATDAAGNAGAAATRSWTVDTTAPAPTMTVPADGATTNDDTPTFAGTAGSEPNDLATVTVRLYEGSSAEGTAVQTLSASRRGDATYSVDASSPFPDGVYTARASQEDTLGHVGESAPHTFTVDTGADDVTPPTVSLAFPRTNSATSDTTPTFSGTGGTDPGDLDPITVLVFAGTTATGDPVETLTATRGQAGAFSVDASASLPEGAYVAQASQSDAAGNTGQSALKPFQVDTTAPTATITDRPPVASGSTNATFAFDSDESGSTFECGLDGALLTACSSPQAYSQLADGGHDFRVRAIDRAGNASAVVSASWTVDTVAPIASITSGPADLTTATSASFQFAANEAASTFRCQLDTSTWQGCTSPAAYTGLTDGAHVFRVQATDAAQNVGPITSRTWTIDTAPPAVTLATPANGSSSAWPKPTFTGTAGTASGDTPSVAVMLYSGTSTSGSPIETMVATPGSDGGYTTSVAAFRKPGTYTARTEQLDAAGNMGHSAPHTFSITDPVLLAAGDIASCEDGGGDEATSDILMAHPDALVAPLGDTTYINGTAAEFANCYAPSWGRALGRTFPTVGDHEYGTPSASGYFDYFRERLLPFGPDAVDPAKGMYSYDVGAWHVVVLNSNCVQVGGCTAGSPMEQWLRADLAAHPTNCTLAYWHHPRFSSGGQHGSDSRIQPFFQALYDAGVEVVLNGNEHVYERFAPQTAAGVADPTQGVRQFTVGTGGYFFYQFGTILPNSEARSTNVYGVIKLSLHASGYDWEFLPEAGRTYADSGSGSCHGTPPPPPPPPPPPAGTPSVRASTTSTANAATSLSIPTPAGTSAGELLVSVVSHQVGQHRNMTPPAGWTAVPNTDWADGNNARIHAWYKVATAFEPASHTFTLTGGSGQDISGGILAIQGANTATPINASNGQANQSSSTQVKAPSITTTLDSTLLVFGGSCSAARTYTPPAGMTEHWDSSSSGTYKVSTEVATAPQAAAGPTGQRIATASSSCRSVGITVAVTPANTPPTLTPPASQTATEGTPKLFSLGSFTDPNPDSPWTVNIDWGDGSTESFTTATTGSLGQRSHTFADGPSTRNVAVKVTDKNGAWDVETFAVTVDNAPPVAAMSAQNPLSTDEGTVREYAYALSDLGADTVQSVTTSCGALGTKVTGSDTNTDTGGSFRCSFPDGPAGSTVSVRATDSDGAEGNPSTQAITVANFAPTVVLSGANPQSVDAGETRTYSYTIGDPGADTVQSVTTSCGGNATKVAGSDTNTDAGGSFQCHFPKGPASSTISARATDSDGDQGATATQQVLIANVAPAVDAAADQIADEGTARAFDLGSFVDSGPDAPWTVQISWGDGSTDTFDASAPGGLGTLDHAYADDATYTVTVEVTDEHGASDSDGFSVSVDNVAPTLTLSTSNEQVVDEGETHSYVYAIADPGADTVSAVTTSCGDDAIKVAGSDEHTDTGGSFSCLFPDGPADSVLSASATDSDQEEGAADTQSVHAANVAPGVALSGDDTVEAGSTPTYTFTVSDAGEDGFDRVDGFPDCDESGAGGTLVAGSYTATADGGSFQCSFPNGPATATVRIEIADSDGASAVDAKTVTILAPA